VLGLSARQRLALILAESALVGALGSALGLAFGGGLAAIALRLLGGDLGGGYFAGVAPQLHVDVPGTVVYGSLGVVAALAGGWLPARAAQRIAPAQALKGLGMALGQHSPLALGALLLLAGSGLAFMPPIAGLPLAAYASVACLLIGGIACVPGGVGLALAGVREPRRAVALLAVERARHERAGLAILAVNYKEPPDKIHQFLQTLPFSLPILLDSDGDAASNWTPRVFPTTILIGRDGLPRQSVIGELDWMDGTARELVEPLLARAKTA